MSFVSLRRVDYYITNQRVVRASKRSWELPLQYVSGVNFSQNSVSRIRGIGNVDFRSVDARNFSFVRVKRPATVKRIALEARSQITRGGGDNLPMSTTVEADR